MIRLCPTLVYTKSLSNTCDRDFSIIKKAVKKVDRIYDVKQYCEMLLNAHKQPNKFKINLVETSAILNFVERIKRCRKNCKSVISASIIYALEYSSENQRTVTAREFTDGLVHHIFRLKLKRSVKLPTEQAYEGPNCINDEKLNT
ncbi:hypothetical protein PR048_014892 [Dryococelus australis]|uniref:Uncharacterized protein n=1 Tax=Dryococelus australis TaxID=614101 RepID=A0ABQ9HFF8_9NEOP|nr:hypothetical protein PR048_014892 [Dryococelus australis]